MKKTIFTKWMPVPFRLMLACCMFLAACSDGDKDEPTPPEPEKPALENFSQGDLSFTEAAGEQSFSFTANVAWTISVAANGGDTSWCTVSPSSGTAGSQTVKISTTENEGYDDRSATVTLKAGTTEKSFVVAQKQKNALLLTTDKFEVEQAGGTITVEVKANVSYTATIGEACKEWITESSSTRALTTTVKNYTIAPSEESEKREGTITFTDGTLTETVHIYQAGGSVIFLSKDEYRVDAAGEEITVELRSNCDYEVVMPQVDWIRTAATRALSSHTLHYMVDANTGYDSRSAQIIYRDKQKSMADTLTIIQAQKDAILLSQKEITVESKGGTIEVKLSANVDFEVTMPDADWLTSANTRGLTEHTLYYKVAANESADSRSAQIIFSNKASGVEDVLTVTQESAFIVVNVPTPGTLPDIVQGKVFEALKITGDLNGTDIKAIRGMTIKHLDLSEANIVKGGSAYYGGRYTITDHIGDYMFYKCYSIESIVLPNSVTSIGRSAFEVCTHLTDVSIPNGLASIGKLAFGRCHSLASISIPGSVASIGDSAFEECIALRNVNISDGVTSIEEYAFDRCTALRSISIPNSVTSIGSQAFDGCTALTSINLSSSVTSIESGVFRECTSLASINIPSSVTSIGVGAFEMCFCLTSINIPSGVTNIDVKTFRKCTSLTSIIIPNSVTSIEWSAFEGCTSLTSISIPNSVTSIGNYAFEDCTSLTSITIPSSVTSIGNSVFRDCTSLTSISLPSSLASIGSSAFSKCTSLTEIYCYATIPPEIGSQQEIKKDIKLYVPKGTYQAYFISEWGNNFSNIIEMEE